MSTCPTTPTGRFADRFRCAGLDWCYTSPTRLGAIVRHVVGQIPGPLSLPADALVAAHDGYWQGRSPAEIRQLIRRYLPDCHLDFRPTSHLWVVTPSHVTDLMTRHHRRLSEFSSSPAPIAASPACAWPAAASS